MMNGQIEGRQARDEKKEIYIYIDRVREGKSKKDRERGKEISIVRKKVVEKGERGRKKKNCMDR